MSRHVMQRLTWPEVWARRLEVHRLAERAPAGDLAAIARDVCGIHAQMMPAAELSLGARVAGVTRREVRAALWDERRLVKTYGIRGTIHLFPAGELPFWMAALRRRSQEGELTRLARMGLDEGQLRAIVAAIGEALDGRQLTLRELEEAVVKRVGDWAGEATAPAFGTSWPRWRMALGWAAADELLCFGPNAGTESTYVRPDQWLGPQPAVDPDEALAEVYRRYLHAYGPATWRDFGQWFNLPDRLSRQIEAPLMPELVEVDVEGTRGYLLEADGDTAAVPAPSVRLLPHFDCYLRGCHPRERLVGPWGKQAAGGTGNVPVLLVDGVVGGVWQRRGRRRRVEIHVDPFVDLSAEHQRQLEAEAARIGQFLEVEAGLTLGPVAVRPHL